MRVDIVVGSKQDIRGNVQSRWGGGIRISEQVLLGFQAQSKRFALCTISKESKDPTDTNQTRSKKTYVDWTFGMGMNMCSGTGRRCTWIWSTAICQPEHPTQSQSMSTDPQVDSAEESGGNLNDKQSNQPTKSLDSESVEKINRITTSKNHKQFWTRVKYTLGMFSLGKDIKFLSFLSFVGQRAFERRLIVPPIFIWSNSV